VSLWPHIMKFSIYIGLRTPLLLNWVGVFNSPEASLYPWLGTCFLRSSGLLVFFFSLPWLPGASLVCRPVAVCLPESQPRDTPPTSTPRWLSQVMHLLLHRVNQSWSPRVQSQEGGGSKGEWQTVISNQGKSEGIGPQ